MRGSKKQKRARRKASSKMYYIYLHPWVIYCTSHARISLHGQIRTHTQGKRRNGKMFSINIFILRILLVKLDLFLLKHQTSKAFEPKLCDLKMRATSKDMVKNASHFLLFHCRSKYAF